MDQVKLRIATTEDTANVFDLICGVNVLQNVTKFKHKALQNSLNINDFSYMVEDSTFAPQVLEFEAAPEHGADDDFKKFYRKYDQQFILEINNNGDVRYVFCKKNEEQIQQIASRGRQVFKFSFITQTHYIKIKTMTYELTSDLEQEPVYSSSLPPAEDGQPYAHKYGSTPATLEYFQLELPPNDGDRKMYINHQILDYEADPAFGINGKWDTTYRSYKGNLSQLGDMALVVNSFPAFKKIEHQDLSNLGLASVSVEELRDFSKQSYTYIEPGENAIMVCTNIRKGRIQFYEQFSNVR